MKTYEEVQKTVDTYNNSLKYLIGYLVKNCNERYLLTIKDTEYTIVSKKDKVSVYWWPDHVCVYGIVTFVGSGIIKEDSCGAGKNFVWIDDSIVEKIEHDTYELLSYIQQIYDVTHI